MADDEDRDELLRRIFYAITCHAEDIAGSAADGQQPEPLPAARHRAQTMRSAAEHIVILADAAISLAGDGTNTEP